jgi:hypothetical protein
MFENTREMLKSRAEFVKYKMVDDIFMKANNI